LKYPREDLYIEEEKHTHTHIEQNFFLFTGSISVLFILKV